MALKEYKADDLCKKLNEKQIIVFNLPLNVDDTDIEKKFAELGEIKNIQVKECLVGLPAYAIIEFEKAETVKKACQDWHFKKDFNDKILIIRSANNAVEEHPWNRTLVLNGLDSDTSY